jgi:hypothetical protein
MHLAQFFINGLAIFGGLFALAVVVTILAVMRSYHGIARDLYDVE